MARHPERLPYAAVLQDDPVGLGGDEDDAVRERVVDRLRLLEWPWP
ncbi:hypothetical protein [Nonomuraea sp. NPDC005501]